MKRIKFPLVMKNDIQVRSLEELQQHFDMESIFEYFQNGKLVTWLEDRELTEIMERVNNLFPAYLDSVEGLCKALSVPYQPEYNDVFEKAKESRKEKRIQWLKESVGEERFSGIRWMADTMIY